MNEQTTPPSADVPTTEMPPAPASEPPSRNTLIAGGAVIAAVCGLIGYQLGDNSSSDPASQRFAGPGQGFGNQQQMMPPGQGHGFQGQQDDDGGQQQGPPMSRAS